MTPEVIAILGVGVALAGMILYIARGLNELRRDVARDIADLRERMARLEGLFEGFAGRRSRRVRVKPRSERKRSIPGSAFRSPTRHPPVAFVRRSPTRGFTSGGAGVN